MEIARNPRHSKTFILSKLLVGKLLEYAGKEARAVRSETAVYCHDSSAVSLRLASVFTVLVRNS